MRKIIGLTGPTGAGKSTVAKVARARGIKVIDCDKVARAEGKNTELQRALIKEFGDDIVKNGDLNRPVLAKRAFASSERTERLNQIMLPFVCRTINNMVGEGVTLLDAPTLVESGLHKNCDVVISVLADEKLRRKRILKRDNLSPQAAESRLSAAKDDAFFKSHSKYVIYNEGDKNSLKQQTENILSAILEE